MAPRRTGSPIGALAAGWSRAWDRLEPVRSRVRTRFTVDARALAALRIALGVIIIVDLVHRAGDIGTFYTDAGVYPRTAYETTYDQYRWSIHALSGALWFQAALFVVAGLFATALVVGYRTRLVGFVSLVLLFSLHARNPAVLNGGDRLFRVLLFVSLVAPLGERWSVDALRRGSARTAVASFGTAALLVQPVAVFTVNTVRKHRGEHWYAGEALEIALHNDTMTIFLGDVIVEYPELLTVLNYGWVTLLSGSALFLLATTGRLRAVAALAYVPAFAGMFATMAVGLFPLVLTAAVIPYLTAPFWDFLARRVPSRWTDRLPARDRLGPLGRPPLERRALSWLRDRDHEFAATYTVTVARTALSVAGVVVLVWILAFAADDVTTFEPPAAIDTDTIDQQKWRLYAPDPGEAYSWYVVAAQLEDGTRVDALDGGPVGFDRPPDAAGEYESFRHRKYMQSVRNSGRYGPTGVIAREYVEWACRQATATHGDSVGRVVVYQMVQPSPIDGTYEEPQKHKVVARHCVT